MKYLFTTLTFLVGANCFAGDKVELFTDSKTCSVKEVGYIFKTNPIVINGTVWEVNDSFAGCEVKIPKFLFEKTYSRCYLTGVLMQSGGSCDFGLRTEGDTKAYMFEFNVRPSTSCRYTCEEL